MAGVGGYQAPSNPAPVSGPGALSQRTDVQAPMPMTGGPYGEATEMAALQGAAPMYAEPAVRMQPPPALTSPTQMPDVPLTAGIPSGPGPGPAGVNTPPPTSMRALLGRLPTADAEDLLTYAVALGL